MTSPVVGAATRISPRARRVLAGIVAVHGLAHGAGVAVLITLARSGTAAEFLGGWWVTGNTTVLTVMAAMWGVLAVLMVLTSVLLVTGIRAALGVLLVAATLSLLLCVVNLTAAEAGVAINIGLLLAAATLGTTNTDKPAGRIPTEHTREVTS
jgi:hypothetical protein